MRVFDEEAGNSTVAIRVQSSLARSLQLAAKGLSETPVRLDFIHSVLIAPFSEQRL